MDGLVTLHFLTQGVKTTDGHTWNYEGNNTSGKNKQVLHSNFSKEPPLIESMSRGIDY